MSVTWGGGRRHERDSPAAAAPAAAARKPASDPESRESALSTLRRGIALSPELLTGLAGTLALGAIATAGRVVVPVAIQLGIDLGLRAPGGADLLAAAVIAGAAAAVLILATVATYLMNVRLYTVSETVLASLRTRAFRHIHDLSISHQRARRRGALVARVTSDVDQLSQFLQQGGVILLVSLGQVVVATAVMAWYSWPLTLLVYATFAPLALVVRLLQQRLRTRYALVRTRVAELLASVGESVVGAAVIRAFGVRRRAERRLDTAIEQNRAAQFAALRISIASFTFAEFFAGLATAVVVVSGVLLGVAGDLTVGRLTAFLFLIALFVHPIQIATEVVNQAQNALAGWRRVLDIVDTVPEVTDPGEAGRELPEGPLTVQFDRVSFGYPGGPRVLSDLDLTIEAGREVAVVGETGGGKTTLANLLVRLMDPTSGQVLLSGVALPSVRFAALRRRVVMVPQDGFLFDATIAENVRFGAVAQDGPSLSHDEILEAFAALGLRDWIEALPHGLATRVGERGESLSVGERQLVALARAYVANPDLLILDEATSAVDPATEYRLSKAIDAVIRGRTTIIIAHRLATARAADEVIVVDQGRVVQRGPHAELLAETGSSYAQLYAAWLSQTR